MAGKKENDDRIEEKVRNLVQEMRDECLVDFVRASDRELVVSRLLEFIRTQIR